MLKPRILSLLASILLLVSCAAPAAQTYALPQCPVLNRGVNIGNCLEAPSEGLWGTKVKQEWFGYIKSAGFDHVRIPINWSGHAGKEAPYAIDETFLKRVDEVVGWALEQKLAVVLDMHSYTAYCEDPGGQRQRLYAIWASLAEHYKGMPETVLFELMNEPNGKADACNNADAAEMVKIIRKTNPDRWIIVDGAHWANLPYITDLKLPEDKKLIAAVHMYEPFQFTHQGASWAPGSAQWLGTKWEGTDAEKKQVDDLLDIVYKAGKSLNVPVYMGEFGAYAMADYESRVRWTDYVARQCELRGMSWGYWEFYAGFGVFDSGRKKYDPKLLGALIPESAAK